jgi:hypothetical protein
VDNANAGPGPTKPSNGGMIAGILVGLLLVIAVCVFLFFVLRRHKDDQSDEVGYDTETEAAEEMIDTSLTDFDGSVDGEEFMEAVGVDGGFALSDAFAQNPEESLLFF